MDERRRDAEPLVGLDREAAGADHGVDVLQGVVQRRRVPPGLRWAEPAERAGGAARLLARLAVELPEDVHRADEPVLVRRHQANGGRRLCAEGQQLGAPGERDVVEVDDVEASLLEQPPDRGSLRPEPSRLVRPERGEQAEPAVQRVDRDAGRRLEGTQRVTAAHGLERVGAVHDVDLVTAACKRTHEAVDEDRVAAEALRSVERGDHAEAHAAPPTVDRAHPTAVRQSRHSRGTPVLYDRPRPLLHRLSHRREPNGR